MCSFVSILLVFVAVGCVIVSASILERKRERLWHFLVF